MSTVSPAAAIDRGHGYQHEDAVRLTRRRIAVAVLNLATVAAFFAAMLWMLIDDGISWGEGLMLLAYFFTLPWLSIGFWNAVTGFAILSFAKNPAAYVNPHLEHEDPTAPVTTRTAVAMAIRNEDPVQALAKLEAIGSDLAQAGQAAQFDLHVLSDTDEPATAAAEERFVQAWRQRTTGQPQIFYRRRLDNRGFKAGNIAEFTATHRDDYDYFLPLDADSAMSANAILRLVRVMQRSPKIGILQGLVVGSASKIFFTRAFQFGMRHGMRAFTVGSAWWQGDCGPFWGHNALIRIKPFDQHCRLSTIDNAGALSGDIMSHDQVEAVLMRRAGYEVRVLAEEDESFEDNPPSLPDFIKRECRWCVGNMQYWWLLGMKGLLPTSRVQLLLAILMYLSAPAWIVFVSLGAILAVTSTSFDTVSAGYGLTLFIVIMTFNLMPKLMGLGQSVLGRQSSTSYGGRMRIFGGGLVELIQSLLVAPCVAFALTVCCIGLLAGRRISWDSQQRSRDRLHWNEAFRGLWPQTLFGLALTTMLAAYAPWAMIFGLPVLISLVFAIPVAVITTRPSLGQWSMRNGLFNLPEEQVKQVGAGGAEPLERVA